MKKLLSILTTIFVISVIVAVCATSVSAAFVPGADKFKPENIVIKKASASIAIDGDITPDAGYGTKGVALLGKYDTTEAAATASLAWDDTFIYIHMVVNDPTKYVDIGGQFVADSIEFYVDFDNNKKLYNKLQGNANGIYAGQFRVQRGNTSGNPIDAGVLGNEEEMNKLIENSNGSVKELSTGGYVVELAFAHGKHALSNNIGFALQVNDGNPGSQSRDGILFSNPDGEIQNQCYKYTSFLDTAVLDGYTYTTTRTKAADDIAPDDTIVASVASSKPAAKPSTSSASSKPTATTSSNSTSSVVSEPAATSSTATSTAASAAESIADTEVDADVSTPDDNAPSNEGGMSTGALIAIIAGGVAVLAGAAIAVILILKKKAAK